MNKFINTIKYSIFALVLILGFGAITPQARAGWVDSTGDVKYDVVDIVVNAGPNKTYYLSKTATGQIIPPTVTLTTDNVEGVFIEDPRNLVKDYKWIQLPDPYSKPPAIIENDAILTPTFKNLSEDYETNWAENVYAFKLVIYGDDGEEIILPEDLIPEQTMYVSMGREDPKALAEEDFEISEGQSVTLNGTRSYDQDEVGGERGIDDYLWTHISGPIAGVNIESPNEAITVIKGLTAGTHVFQLEVTDFDGLNDLTDPADRANDPDTPFIDNITVVVKEGDKSPTAWLDIQPDSCEIPPGGFECTVNALATWGTTNATTARLYRIADDTTLSTELNYTDLAMDYESVLYPSRAYRLVADDDDSETLEVSVDDMINAECGDGYVWGGYTDGCVAEGSEDGVCNNSVLNGCTSTGGYTSLSANTWICKGENGGDDSGTCSYSGSITGVCGSTLNDCNVGSRIPNGSSTTTWYCTGINSGPNSPLCSVGGGECSDASDNDGDGYNNEADPSCYKNCDATKPAEFFSTNKENRTCKKPIYKEF